MTADIIMGLVLITCVISMGIASTATMLPLPEEEALLHEITLSRWAHKQRIAFV